MNRLEVKPSIIGVCLGCWGQPDSTYTPDYQPGERVLCDCTIANGTWPNIYRTYTKRVAWVCTECTMSDAFTNRQDFLEHGHNED